MDSRNCRICLQTSRRMKSIFDCQTTFEVPTFIKEFCNVLISENDEFSKNICRLCLDNVQTAFNLSTRCVESDQLLRIKSRSSNDQEDSNGILEAPDIASFLDIKNEDLETVDLSDKIAMNLSIPQEFESFTSHDDLNNIQYSDASFKLENKLDKDVSDADYTERPDDGDDEQEKKDDKRKRGKNVEKTHICSYCGKTFFTPGHLRSHELTHNDSKEFTCHACGKKFLTKSYLNRHMKSHLNERNYKCKVCEKGFNTSTSLGYHFRLVHSGETNFHCTFCNKGFPLKIQLISHTRSHSGEKPHKCHQCDKKYSHKIDLKRHMMLHTGNKPYKCPYCERTFTKKSNMECHIPTHTGAKPYKCNICLKEFRQPCPYKKHLQTHVDQNPLNDNINLPPALPATTAKSNVNSLIS